MTESSTVKRREICDHEWLGASCLAGRRGRNGAPLAALTAPADPVREKPGLGHTVTMLAQIRPFDRYSPLGGWQTVGGNWPPSLEGLYTFHKCWNATHFRISMKRRCHTAATIGPFVLAAGILVADAARAGWLARNEPPPILHAEPTVPGAENLALNMLAQRSCLTTPSAPDFPPVLSDYARKYNTIEHKVLDDERSSNHVTPQMYSVLDRLIDEAVAELPPYPANISVANAKAFAAEQLGKIDCLLLSHGFVYPGKGLVQSLSDGLEPIIHAIPQALIDLKIGQGHNQRRASLSGREARDHSTSSIAISPHSYIWPSRKS